MDLRGFAPISIVFVMRSFLIADAELCVFFADYERLSGAKPVVSDACCGRLREGILPDVCSDSDLRN